MVDNKENVLLVVDVQPDFAEDKEVYNKIVEYITANRRDYASVISCITKPLGVEQLNKYVDWDSMLAKKSIEFKSDMNLIKNQYGLNSYTSIPKQCHIDVIGMDTDKNVLKVAYDLFDRRYDFSVLAQYCYSSGGKEINQKAIDVMRRNLGKAII